MINGHGNSPLLRLVPWLLLTGLLAIIVSCAWSSDDAWITFRTVHNAWMGRGLTWNPGERVQAYTHPLWMLISLVCYGVTGELYFSTIATSVAFAGFAVGTLVWWARETPLVGTCVVFVLAASGAFVDFATSGLENALLYLLMVAFVARSASRGRPAALGLLGAGVALTRLDAVLLVVPVLVWRFWRERTARAALLMGALPLVIWEIFSLIYYGSFVPNTAIAKLNLEIPADALARQGLLYLADSLVYDPVTLLATLAAVGVALARGSTVGRLSATGVLCYLAYVVRIGGDFMSGRFLAVPLITALACVVVDGPPGRWFPAAGGVLALLGLSMPMARWRSGFDYGVGFEAGRIVRQSGIADERAYYYPSTGLLRVLAFRAEIQAAGLPLPPYAGARMGARFAASADTVAVWNEAGFFGYFAGEKTVVDVWALGDAFLARIPFHPGAHWRVGHYEREVPAGYLASRRGGRNVVEDEQLARLYDAVELVVSGPLFTKARWREIWRLQSGYYAGAGDAR